MATTPGNATNNITTGITGFTGTGFTGTPTTQYNVQVGGATSSTLTNVPPSATSGIPLVSAGSSANPTFSTAVVAGGGTGSTSFNINGAVYSSTTTTGALAAATLTSGQLLIGGTTSPAAANLSAGTGISITNGNNSISIAVSGGGVTWTDVTTATQTLAVNNGYITNRAGGVTYTLPSTAALGDTIKIVGKSGIAVITPNANQQILIGSTTGLAGVTGTATANDAGDCLTLVCITAGTSTVWRANSVVGTWTIVTS